MTIKRMKIQNLLSFGPKGIDLELKPLNVLIGPNGCGKSNLLAAISLFQAAPTDIGKPIKESPGIKNWLWNRETSRKCSLVLEHTYGGNDNIVHNLTIGSKDDVFAVVDEDINGDIKLNNALSQGAALNTNTQNKHYWEDKSFLSSSKLFYQGFSRSSENIIEETKYSMSCVSKTIDAYNAINIYREYRFGVKNTLRSPQVIDRNKKILNDDLSNLFSILLNIKNDGLYESVKTYLSDFNQGYTGYEIVKDEDDLFRFYMLENNEKIPISRLSEGTIRYLCLIAILCNKHKPVLCCIEEPELGMHPDMIPILGRMISDYKDENSKLIVTTHSDSLINSFEPEDIVVCEKHDGETTMERLENNERLQEWLKDYSLGRIWSAGEIGGNRW